MANQAINKLNIPGVIDYHDRLVTGDRRSLAKVTSSRMAGILMHELIELRLRDAGLSTESKKSNDVVERQKFRDINRRIFVTTARDMLAGSPKSAKKRDHTLTAVNNHAYEYGSSGLLVVRGIDLSWLNSEEATPGTKMLSEIIDLEEGPAVALIGGGSLPRTKPNMTEHDLAESPRGIFAHFPEVLIMRMGKAAIHWDGVTNPYTDESVFRRSRFCIPGQPLIGNWQPQQPREPSTPYPEVHLGEQRLP